MKVPPKRKGNFPSPGCAAGLLDSLNESPSEKEGKSRATWFHSAPGRTLNESPSEKEGKSRATWFHSAPGRTLNESPSEKEGKCKAYGGMGISFSPQ